MNALEKSIINELAADEEWLIKHHGELSEYDYWDLVDWGLHELMDGGRLA